MFRNFLEKSSFVYVKKGSGYAIIVHSKAWRGRFYEVKDKDYRIVFRNHSGSPAALCRLRLLSIN